MVALYKAYGNCRLGTNLTITPNTEKCSFSTNLSLGHAQQNSIVKLFLFSSYTLDFIEKFLMWFFTCLTYEKQTKGDITFSVKNQMTKKRRTHKY